MKIMSPKRPTLIIIAILIQALLHNAVAFKVPPKPNVPWLDSADFVFEHDLSDEFKGSKLNMTKWDDHGIRNPDTGCPKWNGPPHENPIYSTYFPSTTDPKTGKSNVRQYRLRKGKLLLKISPKKLSFFQAREYYCDVNTFSCNHDSSIPCFKTNFKGEPVYLDREKNIYAAVVHDKCKREPYCIPHHSIVKGNVNRTYSRLAGPHIVNKNQFKYGFVEVKVKLSTSPAVLAVWMSHDQQINGYCRYRKNEGPFLPRLECPSVIRSRRWQELDILEAMNTPRLSTKFTPNVHSFTMYKGEFTSKNAKDRAKGGMGGGPIQLRTLFDQPKNKPSFADIPEDQRIHNDYHFNPGPVATLDKPWPEQERTIGMYWSPNEIRYYLDGQEVRRLKNTIIHMPMYLGVSHALNYRWGKTAPTNADLRKSGELHYYRTWKVFTQNGREPPSDLELDLHMEKNFDPRYGNKLYGVFDRFPVNDQLSMVPTIPDPKEVVEMEPELSESTTRLENATRVATSSSHMLKDSLWKTEGNEESYISDRLHGMTRKVRRKFKNYKVAGGAGNPYFTGRRRKMSNEQEEISLSRPDRECKVIEKNGKLVAEVLDFNADVTVYEHTSADSMHAAWGTTYGKGMDKDMPQ